MTHALTVDGPDFRLDGTPFDMWGIRLANALENDAVTAALVGQLDDYVAHGVNTFSVFLQGGSTGSANPFDADGAFSRRTRREECSDAFKGRGDLPGVADRNQVLDRLAVLIEQADARQMAVNVGVFYQARIRQLANEAALVAATENTAHWLTGKGYRNVFVDLVNEYGHGGFAGMAPCWGRAARYAPDGGEELIAAFKRIAPAIPTSISCDSGQCTCFRGADLVLVHSPYPADQTRKKVGRAIPVVLNEWGHGKIGTGSNRDRGRYSLADVENWKQTIRTMRDGGGFVFFHSMWKQHLAEDGGPHFELGPAGAQPIDGVSGTPSERWYFELVRRERGR